MEYENGLPKFIYRFEKATEKRCNTLREGKLWASSPVKFNDLNDCKFEFRNNYKTSFSYEKINSAYELLYSDFGPDCTPPLTKVIVDHLIKNINVDRSPGAIISAIKNGQYGEHYKALTAEKRVQEYIESTTSVVCFFSAHPNNPLMWAHYGDNHFGYCVEYKVVDEPNSLYEVDYSSRLPHIGNEELLLCPEQNILRVLTTKHIHWAYEKEFRIIIRHEIENSGAHGRLINFPSWLEPSRVIMGARLDKADHENVPYWHVNNVAASLKVPLYEMVNNRGDFRERLVVDRKK